MRFNKLAVAALLVLTFGIVACQEKGPAEEFGEEVDNAADEFGDKVEDATDN